MDIPKLINKLEEKYPKDSWGSKASLYRKAVHEGFITKEEYAAAQKYYGRLWNYAGD